MKWYKKSVLKSFKGDSFMIIYDKNGSNMEVQIEMNLTKVDEICDVKGETEMKKPQNSLFWGHLVGAEGVEPPTLCL